VRPLSRKDELWLNYPLPFESRYFPLKRFFDAYHRSMEAGDFNGGEHRIKTPLEPLLSFEIDQQ